MRQFGGATLVTIGLVLSGLAGCVGSEAKPAAAGTTFDASAATEEAKDSDGLGAVEGVVVSDEQAPIAGAEVALVEPNLVTQTDASGRFVFKDVPPGSHRIIAQKLGFESVARRVDVTADAVANVALVLSSLAIDEARVEVFPYKGFIAFNWGILVVTCRCNFGNAFGEDRSYFQTNVTKGLEAVVSEYVWQASGPTTSDRFSIDMRLDTKAYPWVTGPSPLVVRQDDIDEKSPKKLHQYVWMPFGSVYISYQQKFEDWTSLFYAGAAPENYTALPK